MHPIMKKYLEGIKSKKKGPTLGNTNRLGKALSPLVKKKKLEIPEWVKKLVGSLEK